MQILRFSKSVEGTKRRENEKLQKLTFEDKYLKNTLINNRIRWYKQPR
jgi:hypothetical protein